MSAFSESVTIDADRGIVWDILADIGEIHRWNPGVLHSRLTFQTPDGLGSKRLCKLPGRRFLDEEVVAWKPQQQLTMRIVDSNLPFKSADIRFDLADGVLPGCVEVTVSPEYQLKYGVLGRALNALFVRPAYRKGMKDLLRGLKHFVEGERTTTISAAT